jgi:xylitol oxidase
MIDFVRDNKLRNWAGNFEYSTNRLHRPGTLEQVQKLVKDTPHLRVLGTRHSFNSIADSTENLVSLEKLDQVIALDRNAHTVTVGAGLNYGQLCLYLAKHGFALHNLASSPHISIAGACATATHGSGEKNGNLATAIVALEIVTADGNVITLSREKERERFQGTVVGLGGVGVVTKVTLNIQPTFNVQQNVYEYLPMEQLKDHFEDIFASGYSVSLFTDWKQRQFNQVWIKSRVDRNLLATKPEFFGAKAATRRVHPIAELSAENCTEQMGIPGPWYDRLPHFSMNFTPSSGEELQSDSEYFIPRDKGYEAILAVDSLREQITPHLRISEIRTIAADDLWMSPCYQQPCMTIHFSWKKDWPSVQKVLPLIEAQLAPLKARPHWGKLFTTPPSRFVSLYSKLTDFQQLLNDYDPQGKFRNAFLQTNIFGGQR